MELPSTNSGQASSSPVEQMQVCHRKSYDAMSRQIINLSPRFERSDTENAVEWIEAFEPLANMSGTPKNEILRYLRFYLTGRAMMLYRIIVDDLKSWEYFRTLFDARYEPEEILKDWEQELEAKKQKRNVNDLALWTGSDEAAAAIHNLTDQMKLLSVNFVDTNQLNGNRVKNFRYTRQENYMVTKMNADTYTVPPTASPTSQKLVLDKARRPELVVLKPLVGFLSASASLVSSSWLTMLGALGLLAALPGVAAASLSDSANYVVSQVGANAVVLGFGSLVGASVPTSTVEGFCVGPLSAVDRITWVLGRRSDWQRATNDSVVLDSSELTIALEDVLGKSSKYIWRPLAIQGLIWALSLVAGSATSVGGGIGIGYALYEAFQALAVVAVHWAQPSGTIECVASWNRSEDGMPPPPPPDVEDEDRPHKRVRHAREKRDCSIVREDGQYIVRPHMTTLSVQVGNAEERTPLVLQLTGVRTSLWAKVILVMLDLLQLVWWLFVLSLPTSNDCGWLTVCCIYAVAAWQSWPRRLPGREAWVHKQVLTDAKALFLRAHAHSLMGGAWVEELHMTVGAESIYGCASTSKTLSDRYMVGPRLDIPSQVTATLMDVWSACVSLDPSTVPLVAKARAQDKAVQHGLIGLYADVARDLVRLGMHGLTCAECVTVSTAHLSETESRRFVAVLMGSRHTCPEVVAILSGLEAILLRTWRVLCYTTSHSWAALSTGPELETLELAGSFRELVEMYLNAVYWPTLRQPLHLTMVHHFYKMLHPGGHMSGVYGPASAIIRSWEDGLNTEVSVAGAQASILVGPEEVKIGVEAVGRSFTYSLLEELDPQSMTRETRDLTEYFLKSRLRFGESRELMAPVGPGGFPWATAAVAAAGSSSKTLEESRAARALAKKKNAAERNLTIADQQADGHGGVSNQTSLLTQCTPPK